MMVPSKLLQNIFPTYIYGFLILMTLIKVSPMANAGNSSSIVGYTTQQNTIYFTENLTMNKTCNLTQENKINCTENSSSLHNQNFVSK